MTLDLFANDSGNKSGTHRVSVAVYPCGDGVCDASAGESQYRCPVDCPAP